MSVLSARYFRDDAAAFEHLEKVLWPEHPVCLHCGSISDRHHDLAKTRLGLCKCSDCHKQFSSKVGTAFESGHIPINEVLQAVHLTVSSKKDTSANQLHRTLGIHLQIGSVPRAPHPACDGGQLCLLRPTRRSRRDLGGQRDLCRQV